MVKDRKIFSFEEKFLKDKDFLSITTITEGHGLTPDTFKNKNLKSIAVNEATALGTNYLKGAVPAAMRQIPGRSSGMYYPTPPTPPTN